MVKGLELNRLVLCWHRFSCLKVRIFVGDSFKCLSKLEGLDFFPMKKKLDYEGGSIFIDNNDDY